MAELAHQDTTPTNRPLPVGAHGTNSVGWWGMLCLIATEASLFAYLLFSYAYFAVQFGRSWLPEPHPSLKLAAPNTVILILSSLAAWWGEKGSRQGKRGQLLAGVGVAIALGVVFLVVQGFEWKAKPYRLSSGSYGSLYFTITGFHMAHVIAGVIMLAAVFVWRALGHVGAQRRTATALVSLYWHFVDVVWLAVFFTFYITPYLG